MILLSRKDALFNGSKKYFTGDVCKNGHVAERYTVTRACTECVADHQRKNAYRANLALRGHPVYSRPVHADDHTAVDAYVDALYLQRGLTPPPATPAPASPPAQPSRLELWLRTHPRNVAIEMLRRSPPWSSDERSVLADERH